MSQPSSETYCSAVSGAVCEDCPLNFVGEADWSVRTLPDVTPFRLHEIIPSVLQEMIVSPADIAEREQAVRNHRPSLKDEAYALDNSLIDTEYAYEKFVESALTGVAPAYLDNEAVQKDGIIGQLHACVGRISTGNCLAYKYEEPAVDKTPEIPLPSGAVTFDLAGDTLATIAKFGSDDDVEDMADRLTEWAKLYSDQEPVEHSTDENRAMLLAIAEVLNSMRKKDN